MRREDHDFDELEDPATWSDDEGVVHPGNKNTRPIVSLRLTHQELAQIEREATKRGLRLTDFIRQAALSTVTAEAVTSPTAPGRIPS
jgi:predicted DNA binding CopG/RHH family protein